MVFLKKINIAKWDNLVAAADKVGPDLLKLVSDFNGHAQALFKEDIQQGLELRVRGFSTMFFADEKANQEKVYGTKLYSVYEAALWKQTPVTSKHAISADWKIYLLIILRLASFPGCRKCRGSKLKNFYINW